MAPREPGSSLLARAVPVTNPSGSSPRSLEEAQATGHTASCDRICSPKEEVQRPQQEALGLGFMEQEPQ